MQNIERPLHPTYGAREEARAHTTGRVLQKVGLVSTVPADMLQTIRQRHLAPDCNILATPTTTSPSDRLARTCAVIPLPVRIRSVACACLPLDVTTRARGA